MINILVINNNDSFVFNIVEYLRNTSLVQVSVVTDSTPFHTIKWKEYDGVVLSPGAGLPEQYPLMREFLRNTISHNTHILGVCLGMQALASATGASLIKLPTPRHGHPSPISIIKEHHIVQNITSNSHIARYHSWVVNPDYLPMEWDIIATDEENNIMILAHKQRPWVGTQFHPESIITTNGRTFINNWIASLMKDTNT